MLAAGVPAAFERFDFTTVLIGYVIMRLALVAQWLRVAAEHVEGRPAALRYSIGVTLVQAAWVARLWLPGSLRWMSFAVLILAELAVPMWGESSGRLTPWHRGHITERYGLFTIIVLGEVVLAATAAVQSVVSAGRASPSLLLAAAAASSSSCSVCGGRTSSTRHQNGSDSPSRQRRSGATGTSPSSPPSPLSAPDSKS